MLVEWILGRQLVIQLQCPGQKAFNYDHFFKSSKEMGKALTSGTLLSEPMGFGKNLASLYLLIR